MLCGLVALAQGERAEPDIKITRWNRRPGNWKSESMTKKKVKVLYRDRGPGNWDDVLIEKVKIGITY